MAKSLFGSRKRAAAAAPAADGTVQVLHYHGRDFVTGLIWHPLGSLTKYMKEARDYGREHQMDIVAIRHSGSVIQAGFVARGAGAMKGMYSLAAALAGQLGNSWLAAWAVDPEAERYALVAVHDGAVVPGSDRVGSRDEIERKLNQLLARSLVFDELYLPAEFGRGGQVLDIEALLAPANLKRDYRLRQLTLGLSTGEATRIGLMAVLVVGGFAGWKVWQSHKQGEARAAQALIAAQQQAQLAAMSKETGKEQPLQALDHPWAKQIAPDTFIAGCNGVIDSLPLAMAGWRFDSAQCDGALVSSVYKRTGTSSALDLLAVTAGHFADDPGFFDAGNSAALKRDLQLAVAGDESLAPASSALAVLTSHFNRQQTELTVRELPVTPPAPPALPGQPVPPAPPPPDWKHYEFQYQSLLPPAVMLQDLAQPGLRLREIKTQLQGERLLWSVTGDLYVQ